MRILRFFSLFFMALTLGPALAHLFELPHKIFLSKEEYFIVQQIYRGWALLGIVIAGAFLSTLSVTIMARGKPKVFTLTLLGLLCIVGAQVVFWTFTYPTNQATQNWTILPDNWQALRNQWEYSHATGAGLNLLALVFLLLSVLVRDQDAPM